VKGRGNLEGGGGGGDAELGAPLAEHLVELLLEDDGVGGAGLLAGVLEAGERVLEVVDAGLRVRLGHLEIEIWAYRERERGAAGRGGC
jgi:hypothetical protein